MTLSMNEKKYLLEGMLRIRRFGERVRLLNENESGAIWDFGQEAVAVGICSAMSDGDVITSTHSGYGFLLARGGMGHRMMVEWNKRESERASRFFTSPDLGIVHTKGLVGKGMQVGIGAAFASLYANKRNVVVIHFEEDAVGEELHEAMEMAVEWQLPVVFVCESRQHGGEIFSKGSSKPCMTTDGTDVLAVRKAAKKAVEMARDGGRPSWIECNVNQVDRKAGLLRSYSSEGLAACKERDPIVRLKAHLLRNGMTENDYYIIEGNVHEGIEQAVDYMKALAVVNQ